MNIEGPINPLDLIDDEPQVVTSFWDSLLRDCFRPNEIRTEGADNALAAELWLRRWLYSGTCSNAIERAIELASNNKHAGFSEQFCLAFKDLLKPLRKNDDGRELPKAEGLDDRDSRIWGLLVARVQEFLEADGLMALVPNAFSDDDGVVVPFRFLANRAGTCLDARGTCLASGDWHQVLETLVEIDPSADEVGLQVGAVFPEETPPGGLSIGLSIALAWARRQAREFPLFSPLELLATGKLTGEKIYAVDGTGGQASTDTHGGAKGQLARRLGVRLYTSVDVATKFNPGTDDMQVYSITSGTSWNHMAMRIALAIKKLNLPDAQRHLQRFANEDSQTISNRNSSEAELWVCWRRLGRLQDHYVRTELVSNFDKVEALRRNALRKLGYKSFTPGFCDFKALEKRHNGKLLGRTLELGLLNAFLSKRGGILPVTGPVGHGKSALLITWRRSLQARRGHSIFYHYFDQSDNRLQSCALFYRRLVEHLLLEVEECPTDSEMTDQDVLGAWDLWRQKADRRPLILVIDGLDEAEQFPPPFPDDFPENLWLVVSCRSGIDGVLHPAIEAWMKRSGKASSEALKVAPLDVPNLCSWLATLVDGWSPSLPMVQTLSAKVHERTGGMALFIHHLLEDLRKAIETGEDLDALLEKTPKGFVEYLKEQWQRLNNAAMDDNGCRRAFKIVRYLFAAKGPLTDRELVTLLDMEPGMSLINLHEEGRRWVDVQPVSASDAWGARFSLNHYLIREAIAGQVGTSSYLEQLIDQCKIQWRDGSPYALRHLADHLIDQGLWRELDGLVIGADADHFQKMQAEAFPDEPAMLLATVRRALVQESKKNQPDIAALDELSLTQATLVYRLAKPFAQKETANMSPLEVAERMTGLPVQWDPAADFMWHLTAAWQLNRESRSAERNTHLNILSNTRDVRLPTAWGLLAGAILTETVSPNNPLLKAVSQRHILNTEAVAEMVGRLSTKGAFGYQAAIKWLDSSTPDDATQLRKHITFNLAFSGRWEEAGDEALRAPTIKEQANLLLPVAELAENSLALTGQLRRWTGLIQTRFEECVSWSFSVRDVKDAPSLITRLTDPKNLVAVFIVSRMQDYAHRALFECRDSQNVEPQLQKILVEHLNWIIHEDSIWDEERFSQVQLSPNLMSLLRREPKSGRQPRLNRLLLEDAFPELARTELLPDSDKKRIQSILGRLYAIQIRHLLLAGQEDVQNLEHKAERAVKDKGMDTGLFNVKVALAISFAAGASKGKTENGRIKLYANARRCRREAYSVWSALRKKTNAHNLEIFQIWLWFADLTFRLVSLGALRTRVGELWECRLRRLLLQKSLEEQARIFKLLNIGKDSRGAELRYLEPVEWDGSLVVAIEAMLSSAGFSDAEILQVVGRCMSARDRAKGLARWVQQKVESGNNLAERALDNAAKNRILKCDDVSAAHSLFARRLLSRGDQVAAARHAVLSIKHGTDTLKGPDSIQRVELLTSLSCAAGKKGDDLFAQAVDLVVERCKWAKANVQEKTFILLHLAEISYLREGPSASNYWFNEVWKLQECGGAYFQDRNRRVNVLCQYARRLHLLEFNQAAKAEALSRALKAARGERSLLNRCELLCEIAEAFAYCGNHRSANEVFADIQSELPMVIPPESFPRGFLWRKKGIKPRLLRMGCLAKLVLGLGKVAIQQCHFHRKALHRLPENYPLPWSEWTWEGGGLKPKERTVVRNIYAMLLRGSYAEPLRLVAQISNYETSKRMAICREIIGILPWMEWMDTTSFTSNQRKNVTAVFDHLCNGSLVAALELTIRLTSDDGTVTGLRMAICRELAIYLDWSDWALAYASDRDLQNNDEALRGMALAAAAQEDWTVDTGVWFFAKQIGNPSDSANTIRDLAEFAAVSGKVDEVLKRAKNLMASREKGRVLHRVAAALATRFRMATTQEEKDVVKQAIFELVPTCAEFFGSSYLILGCLVEIDPQKWSDIVGILKSRGVITSTIISGTAKCATNQEIEQILSAD